MTFEEWYRSSYPRGPMTSFTKSFPEEVKVFMRDAYEAGYKEGYEEGRLSFD